MTVRGASRGVGSRRRETARAVRRALVVSNPRSTAASGELLDAVAARCARDLVDVVRVATRGPDGAVELVEHALREAAADGAPFGLVIAVGGDGTVRETAEGIARATGAWAGGGAPAEPALAIVPAGSGNSAFRALWGERERDDALEAALSAGAHRVRRIDLARVEGADRSADRATLLGLNTGLVARIVQLIQADSGPPGPDRYVRAIGAALAELAPYPQRVVVDGELLHEGPAILTTVGGVRRFGRGTFELLPRSELDDGLLDVCVVGNVPRERFDEVGMLIPTGAHLDHPEVSYAQGRRVEVERLDGAPLAVEHDGDPRPSGARVALEVVPAAVAVRAAR
jgi:diacylglycerol kinase (ATP)